MPVGRFGTMRWKLTSGNRLVGGCMVMSFELSVTQKTKGYQRLTYRSYSSRSCGIGDFMDEILGMGKLFLTHLVVSLEKFRQCTNLEGKEGFAGCDSMKGILLL